jgi:hypothetical protein
MSEKVPVAHSRTASSQVDGNVGCELSGRAETNQMAGRILSYPARRLSREDDLQQSSAIDIPARADDMEATMKAFSWA